MPDRSTSIPVLPVADALPALLDALRDRPNAVLVAPPGAGKTTLVPLAIAGFLGAPGPAPWLGAGRIVMLEPRRLAARAAAQRMAALIGEQAGERVGFRTRIDSAVSAETRIEVVTEGILLRRLLADPTLDGIGCVIVDEVHERSLDADTVLAFCLDLQRQLRPELRILAMSATADTRTLCARLDAPAVESEGRMFPVELRHGRDIPALRDLADGAARLVRTALAEQPEGDVLVFLPGVGEIRRVEQMLRDAGVAAELLPLHGELPPAEQDRVLRPAPPEQRRRHVVLATSIAETSLTVPGVRIVVDAGWRRVPRLDPGSGLSRLETVRVSRAAATQRAGRAGREAPGVAYRLWSETTGRSLALHDRPEMLDADLSGFRLQAAAWADSMDTRPEALPLPDPLPNGAFEAAGALLRALGALDESGFITQEGKEMAQLGAHPRLAAMMLAASGPEEAALAADLAALLEERDPLRPRATGGRPADPPSDLALRIDCLAGRGDAEIDRGAVARIRQAAGTYRRRLGVRAEAGGDLAALVAAGFPDRIAQARGEIGAFRLSGGGSAKLPRGDRLADRKLLAVAALHVRDAARITLAAPLDPERLPEALLRRTTEQVESVLDPASGAVLSRRRRRLGQLILSDRTVPADPAETAALLARAAAGRIATALDWTDAARQFQARVALLRGLEGEGSDLPALDDETLAASVSDWLEPAILGITRLGDLAGIDLLALLRRRLDYVQQARLDSALPTHLALKQRKIPIDYTGPVPTASSRAQDFYGTTALPVLADDRLRLQVALLSPAGRPAAITGDLAGFWRGGWSDARRDLRGRYPRHDWPEDPSVAVPPQGRATGG
ncbi:ATP-dependent helicase HrpB [Acetobacteraceae bacterium KSS8]|uniref:RNA helicase n=1 Tax=Endosaccharibacter trunci TaxID=2812733 RepID=A0ABT1W683_9PROT|nr:ATP-dependent helicase HrpB [Acetobacteraceae bacterium KSS8]